jgi:hypothetical protein
MQKRLKEVMAFHPLVTIFSGYCEIAAIYADAVRGFLRMISSGTSKLPEFVVRRKSSKGVASLFFRRRPISRLSAPEATPALQPIRRRYSASGVP